MADAVEHTLNERGKRYGEFADHAKIAQDLKDVMRNTPGWSRLSPSQKEALEMDAHKTARILNGDPNYADSWHDKQGYARLVEQELTKEKDAPVSPTPAAPAATPVAAPGSAAPVTVPSSPESPRETPSVVVPSRPIVPDRPPNR